MAYARKVVLLVALAGVLFLTTFLGTVAAQSAPDCSAVTYDGSGTVDDPYQVGNLDQLQCIEEQGPDANYVQVSDIDASGASEWNNGSGFEPIGKFNGTFNGQDHNITGLTIDRGNEEDVGLFGFVNLNGTVTNVRVVDADINGSETVGALVGVTWGTVNDSYTTGDIAGSGFGVGGIVGAIVGSGTDFDGMVRDSYSTADVRGSNFVGGLVGANTQGNITGSYATGISNGSRNVGGLVGGNAGRITESYATGTANGSKNVGGLTGVNRGGTVNESYATGDISGSNEVGGLVGRNEWGSNISESYATGAVEGDFIVGGLVGFNDGTIKMSYAHGSVEGDESVSGLVGLNSNDGRISESYANASVDGSEDVGGLVGINTEGTVDRSYWDIQTTGQSTSDGSGTRLNTSEMTGSAARGNMTEFSFTSTWKTVPDDYPVLSWQDINRDADGENTSVVDNGTESGGQGLPGFTLTTAIFALLTVVAAAIILRKE